MIRLGKLTDYGFVLLNRIALHHTAATLNARDLAAETKLPMPTVSKLLKMLTRQGILIPHRGVKGGYSLARRPEMISAAEIIAALEGPIAFTDCTAPGWNGDCCVEESCPTRGHWERITAAVQGALSQVTLAELAKPADVRRIDKVNDALAAAHSGAGGSGCSSGGCGGNTAAACTCAHDMETNTGKLK